MNTSTTNESLSNDPIDKLIFEQGVRIKQVWIDKELDLVEKTNDFSYSLVD